jgi:hypothetical protein
MLRLSNLLLVLLLFMSQSVHAHGGGCACGSATGLSVGGPILTVPAYTMNKGQASIGFGTLYTNYGRLSRSQTNKLLDESKHSDDSFGGLSPSLFASYGLTDRISLSASFPYRINFDYHEIHSGTFERQGDSIGFGDLTLLSKYRLFDTGSFQTALLAGIKLPTGNSHVIADTGERFETKSQPGTGSWDPIFGLALSKQFDKIGLDSSIVYRLATEGAQNTDIGDIAVIGLAASYALNHSHQDQFKHIHSHETYNKKFYQRIFPEHALGQHLTWDLIAETMFYWEAKPEIDGIKSDNHGGLSSFIYPGLRMTVNDSLVCNLNIGLPLFEILNGEQGGADLQMFFGVATAL